MESLKQWISGKPPEAQRQAVDAEIRHLRHEIKNSIQVVQSGNRLLQTMSGAIDLNQQRERDQ